PAGGDLKVGMPGRHGGVAAHQQVAPSRVILNDMDSTNGIFVLQRDRIRLHDRDTFIVSQQHFQFRDRWDPSSTASHATIPSGTPDYDTSERLHLIREGGHIVGVYLLDKSLVIGREGADLNFPADPTMQREHAVVRRSPNHCTLTDLSQRGIFIRRRGTIILEPGQKFQIGRTRFRLTSS
ncbi:MAG: FHA domain-containing protein, partial [Myxococcota bacterium]